MSKLNDSISPSRYSRHKLISGWDQQRIAAAKILVVGAGALGNEVIKLLALLGAGHLTVVDFDTIEITNLTRSVLFREEDICQNKADVAARRAVEINPDLTVLPLNADIAWDVGLGVVRSMDIVIGCLDSIRARLIINRACLLAGVPWIDGGIEMNAAQSTYYCGVDAACYECGMSEEMWDQQNLRHSCSGLKNVTTEDPVPTTAPIASITAGYMVQQALAVLHSEHSASVESKAIYLTFDPPELGVQLLSKNPNCLAHEFWEDIQMYPQSASKTTPRSLLAAFGLESGSVELGFDLLRLMRCLSCGDSEQVMLPLERCDTTITTCPHCGSDSRVSETLHQINSESGLFDTPLSVLCIPEYQVLEVSADSAIHVQITGEWPPDRAGT